MKDYHELTPDEIEIEKEIETYKPIDGKKKEKIEHIIAGVKKNRAISLRITGYDLAKIKEKADKEGLPYQTLITTILHKYITGQLFEKDEILKSLRLLKEGGL